MNSSTRTRRRTLAGHSASDEAKKLLVGLANLRDEGVAIKWLQTHFPDVLAGVSPWLVRHWAMNTEQDAYEPGRSDEELLRQYWLVPLRDTLRAIWRAPDVRTKQWGIFRITQDFFQQGDRKLIHRPLADFSDMFLTGLKPPGRTERLLLEFMRWSELTRFCGNPDCPAPYFIAIRRTQKYCSVDCSEPAQREIKQKWWASNGRRWREARTKRPKKR
jgi:hypothetical protein